LDFGFWGTPIAVGSAIQLRNANGFGSLSRYFLANGIEHAISAKESLLAENCCSRRASRSAEIDCTLQQQAA
jgi:hypothetical protein